MIEHLFHNAHGEWDMIRQILMCVPFVGTGIAAFFFGRKAKKKEEKAKGCCGEDDQHIHP